MNHGMISRSSSFLAYVLDLPCPVITRLARLPHGTCVRWFARALFDIAMCSRMAGLYLEAKAKAVLQRYPYLGGGKIFDADGVFDWSRPDRTSHFQVNRSRGEEL